MARVRRKVTVEGVVQGVFFRDSAARKARQRGLAGWIRNRSDGAVEAVFEGDEADVERLVDFCREGPPRAEVERVEVSEESPEDLTGFDIR